MEQFIMNTKVYMGSTALERLRDLSIGRACIICDPYMKESGKVDEVVKILVEMGSEYEIFSEIVPDPTIDIIVIGMKHMMVFKPDTVIALGGGSAIDTAKAVRHIYGKVNPTQNPFFVAIPTTSGTGSEVTSFAVVSDPIEKIKYPLRDDRMVPNVALLDPNLTVSVPKAITADTGMDVLTHAIEAYVSTRACDFTDAFAEKSIGLVWNYLEQTVENGNDLEAREHMHNASCMAGVAFNSTSLGLCHSMAHAIGAQFHISHGRSNAMLLPHIIAYNAGIEEVGDVGVFLARERYTLLAKMLGISSVTQKVAVHGLIGHIERMMNRIKIPKKITEIGIDPKDFQQKLDGMAENALADPCTITNPRKPSIEQIKVIYQKLV